MGGLAKPFGRLVQHTFTVWKIAEHVSHANRLCNRNSVLSVRFYKLFETTKRRSRSRRNVRVFETDMLGSSWSGRTYRSLACDNKDAMLLAFQPNPNLNPEIVNQCLIKLELWQPGYESQTPFVISSCPAAPMIWKNPSIKKRYLTLYQELLKLEKYINHSMQGQLIILEICEDDQGMKTSLYVSSLNFKDKSIRIRPIFDKEL